MKAIGFILKVWLLSLLGGGLIDIIYLIVFDLRGKVPDTFSNLLSNAIMLYGYGLFAGFCFSIPILLIIGTLAFFMFKSHLSLVTRKMLIALVLTVYFVTLYLKIEYVRLFEWGYWLMAITGIIAFKIESESVAEIIDYKE